MEGFKHGRFCHDFLPIGGISEGSCFTYQMFGNQVIQVTRYVENGISYVAGFCIYIRHHLVMGFEIPEDVIYGFLKSPKLPRRSRVIQGSFEHCIVTPGRPVLDSIPTEHWGVSFCSKLKRDIMTTRDSEGVTHQEWNWNKMTVYKCQECSISEGSDMPPAYSSLNLG